MRERFFAVAREPLWAALFAVTLSLAVSFIAILATGKDPVAGYGYLICGWPEAGRAQVEHFAREILPEFAD